MAESKSPQKATEGESRGKFSSKIKFISSCVGYSIGLGNIWRFSYLAFANGGGSFLISYFLGVLLIGLPMYALELALGQYASLGPTSVFRLLAPGFQGVGLALTCISFNISLYYNVIIAWTLYYLFMSFVSPLYWFDCANKWNTFRCFSVADSQRCANTNGTFFNFNKTCFTEAELNSTSFDGQFLGYGPDFGQITNVNGTLQNTIDLVTKFRWSSAEEFYRFYILDMPLNREYGLEHGFGEMNWPLVGCLGLAWVLVFMCVLIGVQMNRKVAACRRVAKYFATLFPFIVLIGMLIYGATLDGAIHGIEYYVTPKAEFLRSPKTWRLAAVQVFYTLGLGAVLINSGSKNDFNSNFFRDAIAVTIIDTITSTLAGFTTFSMIGYLATSLNKEVTNAVNSGPGLVFIVYPDTIATIPWANFWAIIFFVTLLTVGLKYQCVLFESVTTSVLDQFPKLRLHKQIVAGVGCIGCFLLGLPFCTQGGVSSFTIFDDYTCGYFVMIMALYETVIVSWIYGVRRFYSDIERMLGQIKPIIRYYFGITWSVITPVYSMVIFFTALHSHEASFMFDKRMPDVENQLGWLLSSMPILIIMGFIVYRIVDLIHKKLPWLSLITTSPDWPAEEIRSISLSVSEGDSVRSVSIGVSLNGSIGYCENGGCPIFLYVQYDQKLKPSRSSSSILDEIQEKLQGMIREKFRGYKFVWQWTASAALEGEVAIRVTGGKSRRCPYNDQHNFYQVPLAKFIEEEINPAIDAHEKKGCPNK